jgi:hypothetical protein
MQYRLVPARIIIDPGVIAGVANTSPFNLFLAIISSFLPSFMISVSPFVEVK